MLTEMVSLRMAPVHREDKNSPNKWLILLALAWERAKEWFSSTNPSLGTIDNHSMSSQGMLR